MSLNKCVSNCARRTYDLKSFRSDLKEVLKTTGVEGKPTLLFLGELSKVLILFCSSKIAHFC